MKKSFKQKLADQIAGVSEKPTKLVRELDQKSTPQELIYRSSIINQLAYLMIWMVYSIMLILPISSGQMTIIHSFQINLWLGLFLIFLNLGWLFLIIWNLKDRTIQLKVNGEGIYTPQFQLRWEEVTRTKWRQERGTTFLVVQSEIETYELNLSSLRVNTRYLGHVIEVYKQRNKSSRRETN